MPRASQIDADPDAAARPAKKQKGMAGDQWAESHGAAWQTFLAEKLVVCECTHPRQSKSNRRRALKADEGEGIAAGLPAACLLCFAPIDRQVCHALPAVGLRDHKGEGGTGDWYEHHLTHG